MTDKKPAVRTRKSGEKVMTLPDGTVKLVADNTLASTLMSTEDSMRQAEAAKTAARLDAVDTKRESLASGDAVPDDKRVV